MRVLLTATAVVVAVAAYAAACAFWPYAPCPRCAGTGKRKSPSGRYWRDCKRCKASGKRLRLGRRIFNFWHTRSGDA